MGLLSFTISLTVFLFVASLVALGYLIYAGQFAEKLTVKKRLLFISAGGSHARLLCQRDGTTYVPPRPRPAKGRCISQCECFHRVPEFFAL